MKTLVLTAYTKEMLELVELTSPSKREYASLHGYLYHEELLVAREECHPAWLKLPLLLDRLPSVDRILWIDADAFITNTAISLNTIPYGCGLTASRDWGVDADQKDFSSGGMILTQDAMPLITLAARKTHWANYPLWDQSALREAALQWAHLVHVLPRRRLNAVPLFAHPWASEPWQPGDFICHLTGRSNQDRIDLLLKHFGLKQQPPSEVQQPPSKTGESAQ